MVDRNFETRNTTFVGLNLDERIGLEKYQYRFGKKGWTNSQTFVIGDERYATSYFGDSISKIVLRKNEIAFIVPHGNLAEYKNSGDYYALYSPVGVLISEIEKLSFMYSGQR